MFSNEYSYLRVATGIICNRAAAAGEDKMTRSGASDRSEGGRKGEGFGGVPYFPIYMVDYSCLPKIPPAEIASVSLEIRYFLPF